MAAEGASEQRGSRPELGSVAALVLLGVGRPRTPGLGRGATVLTGCVAGRGHRSSRPPRRPPRLDGSRDSHLSTSQPSLTPDTPLPPRGPPPKLHGTPLKGAYQCPLAPPRPGGLATVLLLWLSSPRPFNLASSRLLRVQQRCRPRQSLATPVTETTPASASRASGQASPRDEQRLQPHRSFQAVTGACVSLNIHLRVRE